MRQGSLTMALHTLQIQNLDTHSLGGVPACSCGVYHGCSIGLRGFGKQLYSVRRLPRAPFLPFAEMQTQTTRRNITTRTSRLHLHQNQTISTRLFAGKAPVSQEVTATTFLLGQVRKGGAIDSRRSREVDTYVCTPAIMMLRMRLHHRLLPVRCS